MSGAMSAADRPPGVTFLGSVRARLLLLALIATLPPALLLGYAAYREQDAALAAAKERLRGTAALAAVDLELAIKGTEYVLAALAQVPDVRGVRAPGCRTALAAVQGLGARFADFYVLDRAGAVLCRALGEPGTIRFGDRDWFAAAMAARSFTVGRPVIGRGTGRGLVPVAYPVLDSGGQVALMIVTGLDLKWIAGRLSESVPESDSTLAVLDREGTVHFRHPDNERWVGTKPAGLALVEAARQAKKPDALHGKGLDGVGRIHGIALLDDFPGLGLVVAVGVPESYVTGPARASLRRNLAILALAAAIGLGIAWGVGTWLVRRPVQRLGDASERMAAGELTARIGAPYPATELGELARRFDEMAAALQSQVAEIHALNTDLERRIAERTRELETANAALADLYDHAPCGYHSVDAEGRFVRINDTWLGWLGYRRDEVIGRLCHPDIMTPSSARRFREECFPLFKRQGWLKNVEFEYVRKDGSTFAASLSATTVRDADGNYLFSRSTVFDITERKRVEGAMNALNAKLEAANRELESFSYSVSHDLRAPLRAVDGYALMLEEDYGALLDNEGRRLLAVVRSESRRMGQLIDDLLAFSRTGSQRLDTVTVAMAQLAREVAGEAAREYPAAVVECGELPSAHGDRGLLKQVWANLIGNALKYSSKVAAPHIQIAGRANGADCEYWVRDNGAGFDPRYADKLFGVFRRLHGEDEFPGTGVGLAIVRRVVSRHGGRVWAEGKPGEGACFGFALPREG
jgi:PAS domain S-box-containing protein